MYQLPKLNYSYEALEPYIDSKTMETHYAKHHQGYTNKLNAATEDINISTDEDLIHLLQNPSEILENKRTAVINNGGGYLNHKLFWEIMSPEPNGMSDNFTAVLENAFGSIEKFKELFSNTALTQFGSGWAWLVVNEDKKLEIVSTQNQDTPVAESKSPILTLDIWEHAYYLKYQNRRAEYIENWWNVVDWDAVEKKYLDIA